METKLVSFFYPPPQRPLLLPLNAILPHMPDPLFPFSSLIYL